MKDNPNFPTIGVLSESDIKLIEDNLKMLRTFINNKNNTFKIEENDPLYGTLNSSTLTNDQVLWFFSLAHYNKITPGVDATNLYFDIIDTDAIYLQEQVRELVHKELQRSENVYNYLKSINSSEMNEKWIIRVYNWVTSVRRSSGVLNDPSGNWEDDMINKSGKPKLETPTLININSSYNSINFAINPVPNATHYNVSCFQNNIQIESIDVPSGNYSFNGLINNTLYTLQIYANGGNVGYVNSNVNVYEKRTLELIRPGLPTNINLRQTDYSIITIDFIKGTNATHTDIDFSIDGGRTWDPIEYPNQIGTHYEIYVENDGLYYFRLRSKNIIDDKNFTNSNWSPMIEINVIHNFD
jgi:hypothetical protein